MSVLPRSFVWRQSSIGSYLRCPRAFALEHVEQRTPDHVLSGFAAPRGTALHDAVAAVLQAIRDGQPPLSPGRLETVLLDSFLDAVDRAQEEGAEVRDPEAAGAEVENLRATWVLALARFQEDPRLRAIRWVGIEEPFSWTECGLDAKGFAWRRRHSGTIDAWGVATRHVEDFAVAGRLERFDLYPGDRVLVDWKSGLDVATGRVARAANVQLFYYAAALERLGHLGQGTVRTFLGALRDLLPYKRPRDEQGNPIPAELVRPNPTWLEAAGLPAEATIADAKACKKRPKVEGGKWLSKPNPAFAAACDRPRGPLFHECRLQLELVTTTALGAMAGAEAGLFPASGVLTNQCRMCAFQRACAAPASSLPSSPTSPSE